MPSDPVGERGDPHQRTPGDEAGLSDRERNLVELHDALITRLLTLGARLNSVAGQAGNAAVARRIAETVNGVEAIADELRNAGAEARGDTQPDVADRLRLLVRDTGARLGCLPKITMDGPVETLDLSLGDELVAAAQEALRNVVQHAYAGTIEVRLVIADGTATLDVLDDGVGADEEPELKSGLGAALQVARARGGSCTLTPNNPLGTIFRWSVPLPR